MRKLLFGVLGTAWFLLVFGVGMRVTFPSDAARDRVQYEVSNQTDGAMALELETVAPWRVSGVKAKGVELYTKPKPKRGRSPSDEEVVMNRVLVADSVRARVKPIKFMGGTADVTLSADLYDGELEGQVRYDIADKLVKVPDLKAKQLDLSRYPFDFEKFSADMEGRARLRVQKLSVDTTDFSKTDGKIRLEVDDLMIDGLNVSGIDLPRSTFSEAVLSLEIDDGVAEVKKGSFIGDTMEIQIAGELELAKALSRSKMNLEIRVRLLDQALDGLAGLAPGVKDAKDAEGIYHFNATGSFQRPSFRPERQRGGRRSPDARAGGPAVGGNKPPPSRAEDPEAAEERRRRREERIRERRENSRPASGDAGPRPAAVVEDQDEFIDEDFEDDVDEEPEMPMDDDDGPMPEDDFPGDDDVMDAPFEDDEYQDD
jgi:type II secretion system protein N